MEFDRLRAEGTPPIQMMGDEKSQMSILVEIKKMDADLDRIIGDYAPQHEIPDDLEERRKIGLPKEYCRRAKVDIPRDFDRKLDYRPPKESDKIDLNVEMHPVIEELKKQVEALEQRSGEKKGASAKNTESKKEQKKRPKTTQFSAGVLRSVRRNRERSWCKFEVKYVGHGCFEWVAFGAHFVAVEQKH
jgi:hypothetical protein